MQVVIVTAANEAFMPLLQGLLNSLWRAGADSQATLACLDIGLSEQSCEYLRARGVWMATPAWDLSVSAEMRARKPEARALTARPFLRDYFPGHDIYVWLDADTWVQDASAIDLLVAIASQGQLAIVPEVDRAYRSKQGIHAWRVSRMQACFGKRSAELLNWETYVNAGVFALRADAPHWEAWAGSFADGILASGSSVLCDQSSLNHMLWATRLPWHPLPSLCNWLCHLAYPHYDPESGVFLEPFAPRRKIGILHLTGETKDRQLMYFDPSGNKKSIGFRCPEAGPVFSDVVSKDERS